MRWPRFVRLARKADNLRGAGPAFNGDRDGAHFLNVDDDGLIAGAVPLANLPPTREAYETALRARGRTANGKAATQWEVGYVPYEIIEGWEQIVRDLGFWRADFYGETHAASAADRTAFGTARRLRETLTLRDIGYWSHFVADGSQPLHISVHFDGWGNYPNPHDYSNSKTIHSRFETAFVNAHASEVLVAPRVSPYAAGTGTFTSRVSTYLLATNSHVTAVYDFEAADAFTRGTPEAVNFMLDRLADGARALRNWIVDAYAAAGEQHVGYPAATVREIESGSTPITFRRLGGD